MSVKNLANKKIAITGATGFLGTALVERLMRCAPNSQLVLLIRPGKKTSPSQRAKREIFKNNVFDRYIEEIGKEKYLEEVDNRVQIIAGDVGTDGLGLDEEGKKILTECDVVIHSAATVSFESPLDLAVEVNLLGPTRVAETLQSLEISPHLIAVSTCYVAGNRRGEANEELLSDTPFHIDVDWREEVKAARRTKGDFDAKSRSVEKLKEFGDKAKDELGAAGKPLLSAKTEQLRQRWVSEQLVESGRARAISLGWPDAYAYTKALGERALNESKGNLKVSIVRPSIIESAWADPNPGWIKGFRMAEPLILNYAKGILKQFPGIPEGIVDVIPVDIVVAAIINVAARGAKFEDKIDITQVASGSTNPLRYRKLIELVSGWFGDNPLYDKKGQPISVAAWSFPGRGAVERQLNRAQKNLELADKVLKKLPLRGKQALITAELDQKREEVHQASIYVKIYGSYAECEALYGISNLLELNDSLNKSDKENLNCDPRVIDWEKYVTQIHLPSVIEHARVKTKPVRSDIDARTKRLKQRVLSPDRHIAAFDLENTIIASNVVFSYSWLATKNLGQIDRLKFIAKTISEGPGLLALDRRDRTDFLRHFYRRYQGAPIEEMDELAPQLLSEHILTKAYPAALRRIREHKKLGHRTVLITGALDIVVKPLKPLFDDIISAEMTTKDGAYTGELVDVPPTGEVRAQALKDFADSHGFDLSESVAYADSTSDLPLLEAVGFPVAVNPESRLATLAIRKGWLIEYWSKAKGSSDSLIPMSSLPSKLRSRK